MKLRNLITIGLMCLLVGLTVGCDEDVDIGGDDIFDEAKNSVVSIGFNINTKLIDYDGLRAAYPSDVTSDWISDATMDAIDAVLVWFHKGTSNVNFEKIAPAIFDVRKDNGDGTGILYAGIASDDDDLVSPNGLTLDVRLVKYKDSFDGKFEDGWQNTIYYLGTLKEYVVIDGNVSLGYYHVFDVTADSVSTDLDISVPEPL